MAAGLVTKEQQDNDALAENLALLWLHGDRSDVKDTVDQIPRDRVFSVLGITLAEIQFHGRSDCTSAFIREVVNPVMGRMLGPAFKNIIPELNTETD